MKRLEDLSEAIVQDFSRMRKNEEEMRDTNGTDYRHSIMMIINNVVIFSLLQNRRTAEYFTSVYSQCVVCWD